MLRTDVGESSVRAFLADLPRRARERAKTLLLPLLRSRRLDACCCGLSKTGTHSLAGVFENYRSAHHPDADVRLPLAMAFLKGEVDEANATRILRRRDRVLRLEMESSSLAGILIGPLSRACPEKKFILTIREVYSWCDSWIDHNLNRPPDPASPWSALDRIRLGVDAARATKFDVPLLERGGHPLACYFQLWTDHNRRVLETLAPDRVLLLETGQIAKRMRDIADWAGVPVETLRSDRNRLFTAPKKHRVLATLDRAYVQDTADRLCGPLMSRYFPNVSWNGEQRASGVA
jgi:sulfotransferase family protein